MINFDEIKQRAVDAVTVIADKAGEVYSKAEVKTKELAKTTQLNAEVVREKNNIKKLTAELGSLYYQLYKDNPADEMAQLCAEITASNENIAELQKRINEIKAANEDIEVEIISDEDADDTCGCEEDSAEEPCGCGCDTDADSASANETAQSEDTSDTDNEEQ
ncbi:MAG: hypothetical protein IJ072_06240 [Oscillospiraceae bacterium]|nr:hypothetical protein [Oscillospiraceae bacterium]